jgi:hypothetical protein
VKLLGNFTDLVKRVDRSVDPRGPSSGLLPRSGRRLALDLKLAESSGQRAGPGTLVPDRKDLALRVRVPESS